MNTTPTGSELLSSRGCASAIRAAGCALLAVFLSVLPASATTVSYQQDVGGYTGTEDTFLQSDPANAGTDNGASASVGWDDDDPGGTGLEHRFDRCSIPQTPSDLAGDPLSDRRHDPPHDGGLREAPRRAVKIHDVEPRGTCIHEPTSDVRRIVVVHRRSPEIAAPEADDEAGLEVDGRKELEGKARVRRIG